MKKSMLRGIFQKLVLLIPVARSLKKNGSAIFAEPIFMMLMRH